MKVEQEHYEVMIDMRMKIDTAKFGDFIAKRRETIYGKQSQILLAEKLHIAGPTLTNIESGKRMPSFGLFIALADALLMTPGELMMVMAEREDPEQFDNREGELLANIIALVNDYLNRPAVKSQAEYKALRQRVKEAREEEADILADLTPGVNSTNNPTPTPESQQIINNETTENS
jgi:transcriptional regulator with XRE-family HTH domain